MNNRRTWKNWTPAIGLIAVFLSSLACGTNAVESSQPSPISNQTQVEESITVEPTSTLDALPTRVPTSIPLGVSRSNPYPRTETLSFLGWEIKILEVKRGVDAANHIQSSTIAQMLIEDDKEYLSIKLHIKCIADNNCSFYHPRFIVTGDQSVGYIADFWYESTLDLLFDGYETLSSGTEFEAWAAYVIFKDESNLMFGYYDQDDSEDTRYIAIDDGASVGAPPELSDIQPNDIGKEQTKPVDLNETIITDDWEITLLEVFRGEPALEIIRTEFENYRHSKIDANIDGEDDFEEVIIIVYVRYIGQSERPRTFPGILFQSTGEGYGGLDSFYPGLRFFPGGGAKGWISASHSTKTAGLDLVLNILTDERFISILP